MSDAANAGVMPPEWAPHERTLMAWPEREEIWGGALDAGRREYAGVANAIAEFEPVLMVAAPPRAAQARQMCSGKVEVVEMPIDDSWLRDSGPIVVRDDDGARTAVCFRFNSWGEKFVPYDRDAAISGLLGERLGIPVRRVEMVLEGGSIAVDDDGRLLTTEQCLLHPSRNPEMSREEIDFVLKRELGMGEIIWLGQGLLEDRDTDGHVDLIAAFTPSGEVLLQEVAEDNPNHANCEENRRRIEAAGLVTRPMPYLAYGEVEGEVTAMSYMNFYIANGGIVAGQAGVSSDEAAVATIADAYPEHEVVGVPALTIAYGGGGPHCITQQVPVAG
jgi:agmatine deiminase